MINPAASKEARGLILYCCSTRAPTNFCGLQQSTSLRERITQLKLVIPTHVHHLGLRDDTLQTMQLSMTSFSSRYTRKVVSDFGQMDYRNSRSEASRETVPMQTEHTKNKMESPTHWTNHTGCFKTQSATLWTTVQVNTKNKQENCLIPTQLEKLETI